MIPTNAQLLYVINDDGTITHNPSASGAYSFFLERQDNPFKEGAMKVTSSGNFTFVATAPAGSSQSSAVWSVKKIEDASGILVTWADGNENFDNIATDLTKLSYL